ncbi:MAG: hypothetical protein GF334_01360 [Candidatus Altiarchaeales archaeon]|nr:hypothetical protein [Candidatus Altiarchaeales archaeon]
MEKLLVNGNEILYHNNGQEMCVFKALFRVGSTDEHDPADYGCAHFLEHIFFKGSDTRSWKEITESGSRLGRQNAYTSSERTCYFQEFVSDDFEEAAGLITDMIFNLKVTDDEFNKERGVILEEYQTYLDDPDWYFFETSGWKYWGERSHRVVGTKKSLQRMTKERVLDFRRRHYKQERTAFIVVGDIERQRVIDFFENLNIPSFFLGDPEPYDRSEQIPDPESLSFYFPGEQADISLVGPRVDTSVESLKVECARRVFVNGFGSGMHSMIYHRIREELGYCYQIGMYLDRYRDYEAAIVSCKLDKKNVDSAKTEMLRLMDHVRKEGFSDGLLTTAKKNGYYKLADIRKTSSGFASNVFDKLDIYNRMDTLAEIKEAISSVTNDDIKAAAAYYFPDTFEPVLYKMTNEEKYKADEYK